jgi:hypothetical protein
MPALKIAKLAVDASSKENYKGIGYYMIWVASIFAGPLSLSTWLIELI